MIDDVPTTKEREGGKEEERKKEKKKERKEKKREVRFDESRSTVV